MKYLFFFLSVLVFYPLHSSEGEAVAFLCHKAGDKVVGVVTWAEKEASIDVRGIFAGLDEGEKVNLAIHQFGDLSDVEGKMVGPVLKSFSAEGQPGANGAMLGPIEANEDGVAILSVQLSVTVVEGGISSLLGRSVVVHRFDEGETVRVGAGVIGLRNPESNPFLTIKDLRDFSRYEADLQVSIDDEKPERNRLIGTSIVPPVGLLLEL